MTTADAVAGRTRAAVAFATLVTVAAACGSSSSGNGLANEPAPRIVAQSRAVTYGAPSAHVLGLVRTGGQTIRFDFLYQKATGGSGSIEVGGQSVSVRLVGQSLYIQGSRAFWEPQVGASAANLLEGRWLQVPATNQSFASFMGFASLNALLDQLFSSSARWVKGPQSSINGQPVIAVTDATPGQGGTLYIATAGPAYLIRAAGGTSGGSGELDLGGYGEPVRIQAPPNPVDLSQLGASAPGP